MRIVGQEPIDGVTAEIESLSGRIFRKQVNPNHTIQLTMHSVGISQRPLRNCYSIQNQIDTKSENSNAEC